jgi:hypothetical protein
LANVQAFSMALALSAVIELINRVSSHSESVFSIQNLVKGNKD